VYHFDNQRRLTKVGYGDKLVLSKKQRNRRIEAEGGEAMLGLMLQLESFRQRLRKRILPMIGSNDYHLVGTVLALILSSGTLITGFTIAPVSLPGIEFSFLTFVTGIIAILSVILWPVGLVLL